MLWWVEDTPATCSRVACGECSYVFCRDCGQGAHIGPCLPCGDQVTSGPDTSVSHMSAMSTRARWTSADPSSVTIRVISKPCPGCRYFLSLILFCNHFIHSLSVYLYICQIDCSLRVLKKREIQTCKILYNRKYIMSRTPTERDGGCMHMICTKAGCGLHWCWVCQVEWTRECMASHWFG